IHLRHVPGEWIFLQLAVQSPGEPVIGAAKTRFAALLIDKFATAMTAHVLECLYRIVLLADDYHLMAGEFVEMRVSRRRYLAIAKGILPGPEPHLLDFALEEFPVRIARGRYARRAEVARRRIEQIRRLPFVLVEQVAIGDDRRTANFWFCLNVHRR